MGSRIGRLFGGSGGLFGCTCVSLLGAIACIDQVGIGTGDGAGGSAGSIVSAGGAAGKVDTPSLGGSQSGGAPGAGGGPIVAAGGSGGSVVIAGGSGGEPGGGGGINGPLIESSNKLDLLFVVDNSVGMDLKLLRFRQAALTFLQHLVAPRCVGPAASVDTPLDMPCPSGTQRERTPLTDIHVGVITTSLGGHGGDLCSGQMDDDQAHLVATVRSDIPSYAGLGFAKWDPAQTASPAGSSDVSAFLGQVSTMLDSVGVGCGYEAQLESWYRFLVDPKPPAEVPRQGEARGIDDIVLEQRAAFLRPDSAVSIVLVSDENDCSIRDDKQGWIVTTSNLSGNSFRMPQATSACAEDPNSPCCVSCLTNVTPSGCTPPSEDVACLGSNYLSAVDDSLNLRCWDQKRRFGVDFLYPTSKYVEALTKSSVVDRTGAVAANPLFVSTAAGTRSPRLVTFTTLVGVPWQDIADPNSAQLKLQSAEELAQNGRWDVLVGANGVPADPFMRESVAQRTGVNPITQDPILPSTEISPIATINGHELNFSRHDDLQPACTFGLGTPFVCTGNPACVCTEEQKLTYNSLCQAPGNEFPQTTQYRAAAKPGLRQLTVQSQIGSSAVVGTICAADAATGPNESGYAPSFEALSRRLGQVLP